MAPTIFHHSIKQVHLQIMLTSHKGNDIFYSLLWDWSSIPFFGEDYVVFYQKFFLIQEIGEE